MKETEAAEIYFRAKFLETDLIELIHDIELVKTKGRVFATKKNNKIKIFKVWKLVIGCLIKDGTLSEIEEQSSMDCNPSVDSFD